MKVACVTTCRGRVNHLAVTLPENMKAAGDEAVFILLDYNDQDGLADYIQREHKDALDSGRLIYYRNKDAERFHMAHAKNQAHRCAISEGADILITLDADNLIGDGFIEFVKRHFEPKARKAAIDFLCPDFNALPPVGHRYNKANPIRLGRGFAGRLAIRKNTFIKIGGYNEVFDTWRGEDIDLIARLDRMTFNKAPINPMFLNAIAHSAAVRFKDYPHAQKYERDEIYSITHNAHDTVVNNGNIGVGIVYRNFSSTPIYLAPLPTRIFGIGFQRTGTTSLQGAFDIFGFDSGHWESAEWAKTIWWEMNKWNRSRTLERHYALSDNPIPIMYERLDKAYPGSKFILTTRDETAWIKSVEKFWTYEGNPQRWFWDEDGFSHKMHSIIYGTPEFDAGIFLERYRRHNAEVMAYFKGRTDFMHIEINENAWMAPLSVFLRLPVVNQPFPHRNKGDQPCRT